MTGDAPEASLEARLRAALRLVAALGTTLTYEQAATILDLRPPLRVRRVAEALERIMAEDAAADAPPLAALVVGRRRGGLPGPGFFAAALDLGLAQPGEDPAEAHRRMCARVWAAHAPGRREAAGPS